jgi:hypothetical protein
LVGFVRVAQAVAVDVEKDHPFREAGLARLFCPVRVGVAKGDAGDEGGPDQAEVAVERVESAVGAGE